MHQPLPQSRRPHRAQHRYDEAILEYEAAIARPMLTKLSAITPRPTQRLMPASPYIGCGSVRAAA